MFNFRVAYIAAFVVVLFTALASHAQVEDPDLRSWNDLQITAPLVKNVDLYTVTTLQLRDHISKVDNARFAIGASVKANDHLTFTPFATFLTVRNSQGRFRYENRLSFRGVYRFPFKPLGISHRSQIEYRFRPGPNSWRYRPSITLEKAIPERYAKGTKVFMTEEPFYDSAAGRFSRNRLSFGVNRSINKRFSLDIYYLYQGDNFSHPGTEHVIGTVWRLKLRGQHH